LPTGKKLRLWHNWPVRVLAGTLVAETVIIDFQKPLQIHQHWNSIHHPFDKAECLQPVKEILLQEYMHPTIILKSILAFVHMLHPETACILKISWEIPVYSILIYQF